MSAPVARRDCPVCGSGRKRAIFRQSFSESVDGSLLSGYAVAVCEDCGFGYADEVPGQEAFDLYYREASKYENGHRGGEESVQDTQRFRSIADAIAPHAAGCDARILEVGCSTGGLLACLRRDGFLHVEGLDPSPACAEAARRLHGIVVRTGTLFAPAAGSGPADIVILVGVLEHVVDLASAVDRVVDLCTARGRVYVEVPDAVHFADCLDAPYQQFSMEHVCFFSRASLVNLMGRHGLRALWCREDARAHTRTSRMPVVCGMFEAGADAVAVDADRETARGLATYVERSAEAEARLVEAVDRVVDSGEAVLVWGLGTLTRRLLATGRLSQANIRAFVDSNPHYQGRLVGGVPVIGPEDVRSRSKTIVIASWVFQDEIETQIRRDLGCRNDILRLAVGDRRTPEQSA